MDDAAEARELVQDIRRRKGVDEHGGLNENATDLENSIRTFSDQLYTTPTRFLLELIQNADDNSYDLESTPQVSIVYRTDGFLWIGCNERGFSAANVRAICRVHNSTKKVEGGVKGYIGEKGIGFKSVFQVADLVWVKSRALQFQFDKNRPLGMITPEWCTFKSNPALDETTMFCFRIHDTRDRDNRKLVSQEVIDLGPELLLFLRQIRRISITVQDPNGLVKHSRQLQRVDDVVSDLRRTTLSRESTQAAENTLESFLVCQHTASKMPFEAKRPGVTQSDVLIAFPVDDELTPTIRSRPVHNFLPIGSYGFPFVLQADFMLSASRETILRHNAWNQALVNAAAHLFVESVQRFHLQKRLQYTWLRYLGFSRDAQDTVFAGFADHMVRTLRNSAVLESEAATLERPVDLMYVPEELTDGQEPLLLGAHGLQSFAHHLYQPRDLNVLKVPQQTPEDFFILLQDYTKRCPEEFRGRALHWHSRLATAILAIGPENARGMKLIPVRGGQWLAAKGNKLFFPDIDEDTVLPNGIEVQVVNEQAARDSNRRRLFAVLGVSTLDEATVYGLILQQHSSHARKLQSGSTWPVEDVVDHAWFLFKSRAQPADCDTKQLLVASSDGKLRPGHTIYMDVPGSQSPVSGLLGNARSTVHFLHARYFEKPHQHPVQGSDRSDALSKKWLAWLNKAAKVRVLPKLAASGTISDEFQAIISSSTSNNWLLLLKDEHEVYSADLQAPENGKLRTHLANSPVLCVDGLKRPLKDVYLPTASVLSEPLAKSSVPMLVVSDSGDASWLDLGRSFHLRTALDSKLYISVLERMQKGRCAFTTDDIRRVYGGLARHFKHHIEADFASKPLVYISSPQPARWVKLDACRWEAPAAIFTLFALSQRYKQNHELFVRRLRLGNATAADCVGELSKLSGQIESIATIKELLRILSTYVEAGELDVHSLSGLVTKEVKILPVKMGSVSELRSFFDNDWFIEDEDTPILVKAFQDKVRVVDCEHLTQRRPRVLLEKLGCLMNLLSERYFTESENIGKITYNPVATKALRAKAEYMSRLVEESGRQEALFRLSAIEVYSAESIFVRRYVKINGKRVYGQNEEGIIALKQEGTSLVIYYSLLRTEPGHLPLYAISEQFVDALNMHKRYRGLAMVILMNESRYFIESELERAGCGRPTPAADANGVQDSSARGKTATRPKVLDLTARLRAPASSQAGAHTVKIGSSVRFGAHSRTPDPECFSANSTTPSSVGTNGQNPYSNLLTELPNGNRSFAFGSSNAGARSRATPHVRSGAPSAFEGSGSGFDTKQLDLAPMRYMINEAVARENEQGLSAQMPQPAMIDGISATEAELAIGRAGEWFVYELLRKEFGVSADSWTSAARSSFPGLGQFEEDEADYADITVTDVSITAKLTEWLLNTIGITAASMWLGTDVNYHIEVKTTAGSAGEPFDISNNQFRLAKQWHTSKTDVMIIVRVFHVMSDSRSFDIYMDPEELRKNNGLRFEAKGGFSVQPN